MLKNYGSYEELAPIQELISLSEDAPPVRVPADMTVGFIGGSQFTNQTKFLNYLIQKRILRVGDEFILYDPNTNKTLMKDYITE